MRASYLRSLTLKCAAPPALTPMAQLPTTSTAKLKVISMSQSNVSAPMCAQDYYFNVPVLTSSAPQTLNGLGQAPSITISPRSTIRSIRAAGLYASLAIIGTVIFCAAYVAHSLTPVPHISDADRAQLDALIASIVEEPRS
jgi:hypothetical protein